LRTARRRAAVEFAEEFTQEWEEAGARPEFEANEIAREFQAGLWRGRGRLSRRRLGMRGIN